MPVSKSFFHGQFAKRGIKAAKGITGIAVLFIAWQIGASVSGVSSYFFPAPVDVYNAFLDMMHKGILEVYLLDSLYRYVVGVFLGSLVGIGVALALGLNKAIAAVFAPLVGFFYAIVESAWLPVFVIWFGYGITTILTLLIFVVAFPILYNVLAGIQTLPIVYVNAARSLGATRWQILREVILPGVLPSIVTGFRIGAGFAFRGLIIAEAIAATSGIGFLIFDGAANKQTDRTIVGMIIMGLLWLIIELAYLRPFERATIQKWGLVTTAEQREVQ